jgi:ABC-type amino acid transport substrate-binding protein
MSDIPNSTLNLVFSVRKDYPEAISILNKGLQDIPIDVKKSLRKKWFGTSININNEELNLTYEEKEYLKNKKVLTVANLQTFPPFNFNENNIPRGYSIDYLNLVAKYLNVNIKFISNKSWNDFLTMLKNKQIDIIPHVAFNDERKKYFEFTNFNHISYTTGVAINKNSDIKSMNDLKNKTIAVTKNSFIQSYIKSKFPNQSLYLALSTAEALNAVSYGKAAAAIGSLPTLSYYIQKDWLSNIKTISLENLGLENKTALPMAVSKDNILLKSILDKVNLIIPHNEVVNLKKKWMDISEQIIIYLEKNLFF